MPWLIHCRDETHAALETARTTLDAFVAAGERNFGLALSGGRIAPLLLAELARQARTRRTPLAEADFFWADERCVGPTHPDSNHRLARTHLLEPLAVPRHHIHRLAGEYPPAEGAALANADWSDWIQRRGTAAARLDCVLLGLGEDGHVASLFPGNIAADLATTTPFAAVRGPKPPPDRLTLGYRALHQARLVVILATGDGKQTALRGSLDGSLDTPLARVLAGRSARETILVTPLRWD